MEPVFGSVHGKGQEMTYLHTAAKLALEELANARDHIYLSPENEQALTDEEMLNKLQAVISYLHQALTLEDDKPLYIGPKRWVGLTDDEREHFRKLGFVGVLAVENKLKEKNA